MSKIILKIGYSCNHRCDFCHAEFNKSITNKETLKTIKKIFHINQNIKEIDTILLSGGEPTIQDNFFKLLSISSSLGFKTGVVTNGSMIYNKEFLDKCKNYNFKYIYLSIHGGTAEIHNKMSGVKNSFNQLIELFSLDIFKEFIVSLNCVVTNNNIDYLEEIILLMKMYGLNKIKFSLLEPKGLGFKNIDNLFVSPEKVADKIIFLINKYKEFSISWDGLPFCLVKGYEDKISNLQTEKIFYMSELYEYNIFNTDYGVREYGEKCLSCLKKDTCYGNFTLYNDIYSDNYLKPYN